MYEDKTPEAIKAEILAAIRQSQGLCSILLKTPSTRW